MNTLLLYCNTLMSIMLIRTTITTQTLIQLLSLLVLHPVSVTRFPSLLYIIVHYCTLLWRARDPSPRAPRSILCHFKLFYVCLINHIYIYIYICVIIIIIIIIIISIIIIIIIYIYIYTYYYIIIYIYIYIYILGHS